MAAWSKVKQQLEGFLAPTLANRIDYIASSYKISPDKSGKSHITVDKVQIFAVNSAQSNIKWYKTEQDVKNDNAIEISVTEGEIESVRKTGGDKIPEERLIVIAKSKKSGDVAKQIMAAQTNLYKSNFYDDAAKYLTSSVEECLASENILLTIFGLMDRRVGKKRLRNMREEMKTKHPIVQFFYALRCEVEKI